MDLMIGFLFIDIEAYVVATFEIDRLPGQFIH